MLRPLGYTNSSQNGTFQPATTNRNQPPPLVQQPQQQPLPVTTTNGSNTQPTQGPGCFTVSNDLYNITYCRKSVQPLPSLPTNGANGIYGNGYPVVSLPTVGNGYANNGNAAPPQYGYNYNNGNGNGTCPPAPSLAGVYAQHTPVIPATPLVPVTSAPNWGQQTDQAIESAAHDVAGDLRNLGQKIGNWFQNLDQRPGGAVVQGANPGALQPALR